jgi:hypothetical protein
MPKIYDVMNTARYDRAFFSFEFARARGFLLLLRLGGARVREFLSGGSASAAAA